MADSLARAQLARLAQNFAPWRDLRLPALVFLTDDGRVRDPLPAIRALPRGCMVVLRYRDRGRRRELAHDVSRIARERRLLWIVAGDPDLAMETRAHGVHFSEAATARAAHWRAKRPLWLITCAAHSLTACVRASRAGADAIFLAPILETRSHPGRPCLGPLRARMIAKLVDAPIYALGGIDARSARQLSGARFAGFAAIGALMPDEKPHPEPPHPEPPRDEG